MGYEGIYFPMTLPGSCGEDVIGWVSVPDVLAIMVDFSIAMRWKRRSLR